eukprot:m.65746 g.65746  ORF g.65746 m.65746 type:complete len:80 (+) comp35326_c0_seq22:1241-1480(+)
MKGQQKASKVHWKIRQNLNYLLSVKFRTISICYLAIIRKQLKLLKNLNFPGVECSSVLKEIKKMVCNDFLEQYLKMFSV